MKKYIILLLCLWGLTCCKKSPKVDGKKIKSAVTAVTSNSKKVAEKELGKPLEKAISVLSKESRGYLLKVLGDNPKLLAFFKERPEFVSTWEYLRKYLPEDCLNPEFLKMFIYANKYASYSGNKLENFVFKKSKDGLIEVFDKEGKHLLATIKPGRVIEVVGNDVNNWFLQLKPFPNSKYIINGAEYMTDDAGRIVASKAKLPLPVGNGTQFRDGNVQKQMGKLKGSLQGDDAGHIIGNQFGGSSNMVNLVPMKGNVNKGVYKQMENEWRRAIDLGKKVDVEIKIKYPHQPKNCERPDWIEVIYDIDGQKVTKLIKNAA